MNMTVGCSDERMNRMMEGPPPPMRGEGGDPRIMGCGTLFFCPAESDDVVCGVVLLSRFKPFLEQAAAAAARSRRQTRLNRSWKGKKGRSMQPVYDRMGTTLSAQWENFSKLG